MSEEEERRFDAVAVSVWFFAGAVALFLLSLLAIAIGVLTLLGGAHPGDNRLSWTISCFAIGLALGVGGGLLWRRGVRKLGTVRRQPRGFQIDLKSSD